MKNRYFRLIALICIICLAVSCTQRIMHLPDRNPGGSSSPIASDISATFGDISWDDLVEKAVNQAGKGEKDGMTSTLGAATAASSRSINSLVLTIVFNGYKDASGAVIESGTASFTLESEKISAGTIYAVSSYKAETAGLLISPSYSASPSVSVSFSISGKGSMTVKETAGGAFAASNVSLSIMTGSGTISANGERDELDDVFINADPEPETGSSEKPYIINDYLDVLSISYMLTAEPFYAELGADLVLPNACPVYLPENTDLHIDLQSYDVWKKFNGTPAGEGSDQRTYGDSSIFPLIQVNGGSLEIKGNGSNVIGGSLFENPNARIIYVKDGGHLDLEGVIIQAFSNTAGSAVYIENSTADIRNCEIYGTYFALRSYHGSEVTVRNTIIASCASNQLASYPVDSEGNIISGKYDSGYAYALDSIGDSNDFDDIEVYGIQGAISISGGRSELGPGIYSYTGPKVFEHMPEEYHDYYINWRSAYEPDHQVAANEIWSALYVAGENAAVKAEVNGGTYITDGSGNPTVRVGNAADGDGGLGKEAATVINDGTFINTSSGVAVEVSGVTPGEYGYGTLNINGGRYMDKTRDLGTLLPGFINSDTHEVIGPDDEGFYSVVLK